MNKNTISVEKYIAASLSRPKSFEVRIKKGITIILFAVGMSTMVSPKYNIGLPKNDTDEITYTRPYNTIDSKIILMSQDNPVKVSGELRASLMLHRGNLLSTNQMLYFEQVASQLQNLIITDALVRYNEKERHISYDMLLAKSHIILHLTQYFDKPADQLVYSIERDNRFIKTGYTPIKGFAKYITEVIDEVSSAV